MDFHIIIALFLTLAFGYFIYNFIACHMKKQEYTDSFEEEPIHI